MCELLVSACSVALTLAHLLGRLLELLIPGLQRLQFACAEAGECGIVGGACGRYRQRQGVLVQARTGLVLQRVLMFFFSIQSLLVFPVRPLLQLPLGPGQLCLKRPEVNPNIRASCCHLHAATLLKIWQIGQKGRRRAQLGLRTGWGWAWAWAWGICCLDFCELTFQNGIFEIHSAAKKGCCGGIVALRSSLWRREAPLNDPAARRRSVVTSSSTWFNLPIYHFSAEPSPNVVGTRLKAPGLGRKHGCGAAAPQTAATR